MKKSNKRFLIGLSIVVLLYFIFFLVYFFNQEKINFIEFVVLPLFCYLGSFLAFKINIALGSHKFLVFSKWLCLIVFGLFPISNLFDGLTINDLDPFVVFISVLCNWNIEPEKQKLIKEDNQEKENQIQYYLIHFLFLNVIYIVSAMIYYRQTGDQSDRWIMILVCAICLPVSFWGLYLFYRFILKRNKATTVYKIFMIFICGYLIYTFSSTKQRFIDHLLIIIDIVSLISITVQDLVLNRKIQNNKSEDSKKCLT